MEEKDLETILKKLDQLREDFQMLKDDIWVPDSHSCDASIDNVEDIIYILTKKLNQNKDE